MKTYKDNIIFICTIILIFSVTAVFGSVITFGVTADWTSILKQYPDSKCAFADMNGDSKSELLIYDAGELIVYANINNTYSEAGTVSCEDYSVCSADNNNGIAVSRSLNGGWCYDKYVLHGNKLVQDGVIASYEYDENSEKYKIGQKVVDTAAGRKKMDELDSVHINFQTYEICSTDDWYSAYKNVIDQYINITDEPADISDDVLTEKYKDVNLNYILYERTETSSENLYALKDLDNNNTPELIIANGTGNNSGNTQGSYITFNIYTFKDGVLVNFDEDMGDRYRCDILDTNEIYEESSGGAGATYYSFYELNDGKFETKDAYALLGENMGSSDSEFFYSFKNGTVINDSELDNIVSQAKRRVIQPDWKPLYAYASEEPASVETSASDLSAANSENDIVPQHGLFESIKGFIQAISDIFSTVFRSLLNFGNMTSEAVNTQTESVNSDSGTDNIQTENSNNPDWISVLKQYPDGCCTFEDINADNIPELLISANESLMVFIQDNNTYQLTGTIPFAEENCVQIFTDHSGFATNTQILSTDINHKYILENGEITKKDITENEYTDAGSNEYNFNSYSEAQNYISEHVLKVYSATLRPYYISDAADWHSAYEQVTEQYRNIRTDPNNQDSDYLRSKYKYVSQVYYNYGLSDDLNFIYTLKDLDNNGVPELLIAEKTDSASDMPQLDYYMADIYTFKDGLLISLDGGQFEHFSNYILNDNEIMYDGGVPVDGTVDFLSFYKVNDGKIENGDIYIRCWLNDGMGQDFPDLAYKNGESIDLSTMEETEKNAEAEIALLDWKSIDDFE